MSGMEPVAERMSLVDQVHARLVEAVCSGDLAPGTPLRQEWLAEELNVSRQPIIQALSMLKRDGLIEPAGKRGFQVTAVDAQPPRHVYDLRAAFDGLAARLAAGQSDTVRRHALIEEMKAGYLALKAEDTTALVQADIAFHQAIYELSGNPMLPEASAAVWRQIRRVMRAVLEHRTARASVWEEHAGIADAIRQGDAALAETRAVNHARDAADQLIGWMIERN